MCLVLCRHLGNDSPCLAFRHFQCGVAVSQILSCHIHFRCVTTGSVLARRQLCLARRGQKPSPSCHSCQSDFCVAKYPCGFVCVVENILIIRSICFVPNRHQNLKNRELEAKNIRLVEFCFLCGSFQVPLPLSQGFNVYSQRQSLKGLKRI